MWATASSKLVHHPDRQDVGRGTPCPSRPRLAGRAPGTSARVRSAQPRSSTPASLKRAATAGRNAGRRRPRGRAASPCALHTLGPLGLRVERDGRPPCRGRRPRPRRRGQSPLSCLRTGTVDALGDQPHELLAAARDDEVDVPVQREQGHRRRRGPGVSTNWIASGGSPAFSSRLGEDLRRSTALDSSASLPPRSTHGVARLHAERRRRRRSRWGAIS